MSSLKLCLALCALAGCAETREIDVWNAAEQCWDDGTITVRDQANHRGGCEDMTMVWSFGGQCVQTSNLCPPAGRFDPGWDEDCGGVSCCEGIGADNSFLPCDYPDTANDTDG